MPRCLTSSSVALLLACLGVVGLTEPARAAVPGMAAARPRTLVVVRVVFAPGAPDPAPPATVESVFHRSPMSVNALFGAQTGGALSFRGATSSSVDVLPKDEPPLVVPYPESCDAIPDAVVDAVWTTYGATLAAYDHVAIAIPKYACRWAGIGHLFGRWSVLNGPAAFASSRVVSHELGHNLGADHATTWSCTDAAGVRVALSDRCKTEAEYGDPFDVMGSLESTSPMSAYNRLRTSQFPASQVEIATAGDHALHDLATTDPAGPRLLLVPRPRPGGDQPTEAFSIELRSPLAPFDPWTATGPAATGLTIRLVPWPSVDGPTKLIDTTPGTGTFADAPLGDQRTLTDPESGVRIALVSRQGQTATVRIGGEAPVDTIPPTFSPGSLSAVVVNRQVVLGWPVATDAFGVDRYELMRDGVLVATVRARTATDTLPAGADGAAYTVRAIDAAGNATTLGPVSVAAGASAPAPGAVGAGGAAATGPAVPGSAGGSSSGGAGSAAGTGGGRSTAPGTVTARAAVSAGKAPVRMTSPGFVGREAVVPRSRLLKFAAPGAGRLVVTVDGRRVARATGSAVRIRLRRAASRRATIVVVASRGTLPASARITLKVRRGVITVG